MIPPKGVPNNQQITERRFTENLIAPPTSSKYPLAPFAVSNSTVTIFEVPAGEYWCVDHISAHNPDGTATPAVTFHYVPSGDSPATANKVFYKSFAVYEGLEITAISGTIFGPGDTLQAVASIADGVNVYGGVTRVFSGS